MAQEKAMFAAGVRRRPIVPPDLLQRVNAECDRRYPSVSDVRRGYFRHGWLDRALGEPESVLAAGRNAEHYRAGWNAAAVADPSILEREQLAAAEAENRRRERLAAQFDRDLEQQEISCAKGVHPPGARVIRGGRLFCTACNRSVRP